MTLLIESLRLVSVQRLADMRKDVRDKLKEQCDRVLREIIVLDAADATGPEPRTGRIFDLARGNPAD